MMSNQCCNLDLGDNLETMMSAGRLCGRSVLTFPEFNFFPAHFSQRTRKHTHARCSASWEEDHSARSNNDATVRG